VTPARRPLTQAEDAVVRQGHLTRPRHLAPPISPTSAIVWCGARHKTAAESLPPCGPRRRAAPQEGRGRG